jgi:hypothetical protein
MPSPLVSGAMTGNHGFIALGANPADHRFDLRPRLG